MRCLCGFDVAGEGRDAVLDALRSHVDEAHADLGLTPGQLEDFADAGMRAKPWDGQRLPLPAEVTTRPLSVDTKDDFLTFMEREGFADNPAWAACYCMASHCEGGREYWEHARAADNKRAIVARIAAGTTSGVLAYGDGRVIGWCNAGPRAHRRSGLVPRLEAMEGPDDGVGSIVCFVVSPWYRKQGLAGRLVEGALDLMRKQGLTVAEAYPLREPRPHEPAFTGNVALFSSAGFEPVRDVGPITVMRKPL